MAEPASGTGTLVEFEVEALETGSSELLLGSVILASPEGAQLPVQLPDASLSGMPVRRQLQLRYHGRRHRPTRFC